MNVHIGTQFNFWITGDSATDIADTKVTHMLAAITHQLIFELYMNARSSKLFSRWDVALSDMGRINFKYRYKDLIKECQDILYGSFEMVTRDLPDASDRSY